MKFAKSSLFLALFGGLSFSALADVDVYGKANVTVQSSDDGEGSFTEIKSNNSRFGLKGSEKITEGLEAVYKLEFGVDVSDADSKGDNDDNITARNQYVLNDISKSGCEFPYTVNKEDPLTGGLPTIVVGENPSCSK